VTLIKTNVLPLSQATTGLVLKVDVICPSS